MVNLLTEQRRGILGYIFTALIVNILNIIISKNTKLSIQQTTFLAIYVIGNILLYSLDILFAKAEFNIKSYKGIQDFYGTVPYNDIATRFNWLLNSLYQKYFFRFMVTVILDTIIGLNILRYTIYKLDEYEILINWKHRNFVVASLVASITYFLYLGSLRFKWAYEYKDNMLMNILVPVWLSLAILITVNQNDIQGNVNTKWRYMF